MLKYFVEVLRLETFTFLIGIWRIIGKLIDIECPVLRKLYNTILLCSCPIAGLSKVFRLNKRSINLPDHFILFRIMFHDDSIARFNISGDYHL